MSSAAHANLVRMATAGMTLDLLAAICDQLAEHLPRSSDPDMALNNLDRFVAAARNPLSLGSLFERDREALPILLQIFSTSQYLSDLLITDPESYDLLRMTEGQPVGRELLVDELASRSRQRWTTSRRWWRRCGASNAAKRCGSPTATSSAASRWTPSRGRFRIWPMRLSKRPSRSARRNARSESAACRATPTASRPGSSSWRWASSAARS